MGSKERPWNQARPNGSGKTVSKDITIATAVQEKGQYLTKQNCSCKHGTEL